MKLFVLFFWAMVLACALAAPQSEYDADELAADVETTTAAQQLTMVQKAKRIAGALALAGVLIPPATILAGLGAGAAGTILAANGLIELEAKLKGY